MVAEGDDTLMETFFEQGNLSDEQMLPAPAQGHSRPQDLPGPLRRQRRPRDRRREAPRRDRRPAPDAPTRFQTVARNKDGQSDALAADAAGPAAALVFKTLSDPFTGPPDALPRRLRHAQERRHLLEPVARGRRAIRPGLLAPRASRCTTVPEAPRRRHRRRRQAQGDARRATRSPPRRSRSSSRRAIRFPEPAIAVRDRAEVQGRRGQDRRRAPPADRGGPVAALRARRATRTSSCSRGTGQLHVEIAVARHEANVRASRSSSIRRRCPYRETITRPGRGARPAQEADAAAAASSPTAGSRSSRSPRGARLRVRRRDLRRLDPAATSVPRSRRASRRLRKRGFLAGYPMVDFRVRAATTASTTTSTPRRWRSRSPARWPTRTPWRRRSPTILEPIMKVEIHAPRSSWATSWATSRTRRGRPQGMEPEGDDVDHQGRGAAGRDVSTTARPARR